MTICTPICAPGCHHPWRWWRGDMNRGAILGFGWKFAPRYMPPGYHHLDCTVNLELGFVDSNVRENQNVHRRTLRFAPWLKLQQLKICWVRLSENTQNLIWRLAMCFDQQTVATTTLTSLCLVNLVMFTTCPYRCWHNFNVWSQVQWLQSAGPTVSSHHFNSHNFKWGSRIPRPNT